MQPGHDDDEPDTLPCYRHPDRQTALHCNACERPVCVDCAVHGAVGIKCPDCARTSRAARGVVPAAKLARGIAAAIVTGLVLGVLHSVVNVAYLGIILAYVAGVVVGEVARRASGGYRDPVLARVAASAAGLGMVALPALGLATGSWAPSMLFWSVVAAGFAAWAAYQRAS